MHKTATISPNMLRFCVCVWWLKGQPCWRMGRNHYSHVKTLVSHHCWVAGSCFCSPVQITVAHGYFWSLAGLMAKLGRLGAVISTGGQGTGYPRYTVTYAIYTCVCVYAYTNAYAYMHIHMCMCICIFCIRTCLCIYIRIRMCICI